MNTDQRTWHISKEIPVAHIITMVAAVFAGGVAYQTLKSEQSTQGAAIAGILVEMKDFKIDLRKLSDKMQSGEGPNAVNNRRVEEMERNVTAQQLQLTQLMQTQSQQQAAVAALAVRMVENERRLAGTDARTRAMRER